jgi:hypothetical protein
VRVNLLVSSGLISRVLSFSRVHDLIGGGNVRAILVRESPFYGLMLCCNRHIWDGVGHVKSSTGIFVDTAML